MLQEHVAGGPESVWIFNGYFDSDSRCLFGCTGRTLRQWPVWTGATSLGFCAPNPEIERMVIELMKAIEYHGPVEVGLRHDHREGRYRLLDVNPRIGRTFRLFLGDTGLDVARVMHLDLTGRPVPATGCSGGRRWNADLIRAAEFMREGELDGGHDPGPFARMTMALASSVVRRRARDLRPL
jgi:predicted ATP-grasp superfamily ATP-dependent carboligase